MSSILLSAFQYTRGCATQTTCEGSLENKAGKRERGNDTADLHFDPATSCSPTGRKDSSGTDGVTGGSAVQ